MNLYINLLNYRDSKLAGTGYFMKRLFEGLPSNSGFYQRFTKIIILCPKNIDTAKVFNVPYVSNVRFKRVAFIHRFLILRILYEQLILPVYLLVQKPCIYFAPNPVVPLLSKFLSPKTRTICTIHDMIPFHIPEKYGYFRGKYIQSISVLSARLSTKVITVSEFSKIDIVNLTGISADKISVVYNFMNAKLSLNNPSLPFFITVCTIEPGKNIELMLDGFTTFLERNSQNMEYKYYLIGKPGWNYEAIYQYVKNLSSSQNIFFLGYLDENRKEEYIKNCTALLYLSKYEGFGIPILEAMYQGKPSIVSGSSALPEVVGKTGVILDELTKERMADGMESVINNQNLYIQHIPGQIKKFKPELQIERFVNLFN